MRRAASLAAGGAIVAAWDDNAASREAAAKPGIPLVDLEAADWSRFAALVLAPACRSPIPSRIGR